MKKFGLVSLVLILMLSGCSSKFAYNNLDWLIYWYTDDYVELNKPQKKLFDQKLTVWLDWHRSDELVQYKQHLEAVKADLELGPLSEQQILTYFEQGRGHWLRFRDKVIPELIPMATELSDEQIEALFAALEKDNVEEEEERAETTAEERLKDNIKSTQSQMKDWIGKLSSQQKQLITETLPLFRTNFDNWLAYRRKMQAAAKELLMNRQDGDFSQKLVYLMSHPEEYQDQAYVETSEHNRQTYARFLAQMSSTLSAKQKRKLLGEIDDVIEDLEDLIDD